MKAILIKLYSSEYLYEKSERSQIDNNKHLKVIGEQEQVNHKISRRKEIITIRNKTNKIETKGTIQRTSETSCFYER
jgi:CTP-dependent riboflavin kinase